MPTVNLPLGSYGIFVPAADLTYAAPTGGGGVLSAKEGKEEKKENKKENKSDKPASSIAPKILTQVDPGVWAETSDGVALLNVTKFLQQFVTSDSPNASLGGQFGAGILTGFDIVHIGDASGVEANLFEVHYFHERPPFVRNKHNTPQFELEPDELGHAHAGGHPTVSRIELKDYWLIGQNNPNVSTFLQLEGVITLVGITIYFGNIAGGEHHGRGHLP